MVNTTAITAYLPQENKILFFALRSVAVPLALVMALLLAHPDFMVAIAIIIGQAHFLMAYLYQWRAKKMTRGYFILAAAFVALIALYVLFNGNPLPLYFGVSILFALHLAIDEFTLHDEVLTIPKLVSVLGFWVLFSALVVHVIFPMPMIVLGAFVLTIGGIVWRTLLSKEAITTSEYYLWFLAILIALLVIVIPPAFQVAITVFVLLAHFMNWIIGYGIKTMHTPRAKKYWTETGIFMTVCTVGYLLFWFSVAPLLSIFFAASAYYIWGAAHILFSFYLYRPQWG